MHLDIDQDQRWTRCRLNRPAASWRAAGGCQPRDPSIVERVRRRQDDHCAARSLDPQLRHRRDRQRQLALQEQSRRSHVNPRSPRLPTPTNSDGANANRSKRKTRGSFWMPIWGPDPTPIDSVAPAVMPRCATGYWSFANTRRSLESSARCPKCCPATGTENAEAIQRLRTFAERRKLRRIKAVGE